MRLETSVGLAFLGLAVAYGAAALGAAREPVEETSTPLPAAPAVEPDPWIGEEEPLLAGPRLEDEASERSLVKFDFNGGLRRLDRSPEEAALDALNLDSSSRDAADAILTERFSALDDAVRGNLELLIELNVARQAGNKPEAAVLLRRLLDKLEPLRMNARAQGRVRDRIAYVLPNEERREFSRLIDEYWRALVQDEMQQAEIRKEKLTLTQAYVRVTLGAVGTELRRSFERQFKAREKQFESLLVSLNLFPEQETKVRKVVQEFVERTKGKPNARESFELTMKILPELDPSQRRTLAAVLLGVSPMAPEAQEAMAAQPGVSDKH